MILTRTVERKDFYLNFYKSLNYVLNLSKKELLILSLFANTRANLPKDLSTPQLNAMTFSSANRKIIAGNLNISIFNLNNYIKSLKTKQILIEEETLMINPRLWVDYNGVSTYSNEFKFNIA